MDLSDVIRETTDGVDIEVFCRPKASKDEITGLHAGRLKVKVQASPQQGNANRSLTELLARTLGVPRSRVRVVAGESSRIKRLHVEGVDRPSAQKAIAAVL